MAEEGRLAPRDQRWKDHVLCRVWQTAAQRGTDFHTRRVWCEACDVAAEWTSVRPLSSPPHRPATALSQVYGPCPDEGAAASPLALVPPTTRAPGQGKEDRPRFALHCGCGSFC